MAVNSGLAAYPASYTRVWSGAGGAIWRPAPPPGYVAAGDLFTADDQEPELSDMICLHGENVPAEWQRININRAGMCLAAPAVFEQNGSCYQRHLHVLKSLLPPMLAALFACRGNCGGVLTGGAPHAATPVAPRAGSHRAGGRRAAPRRSVLP